MLFRSKTAIQNELLLQCIEFESLTFKTIKINFYIQIIQML